MRNSYLRRTNGRKGKKGFRIDIPRFFAYGLFSCLMVVAFFEFIKDITNQNIKLANGITSESLKSSMKHVEKGLETYETKINTLVKFYSDQTFDNEKSKEQFIQLMKAQGFEKSLIGVKSHRIF